MFSRSLAVCRRMAARYWFRWAFAAARGRKEPGHLYVREKDPRRESFHAIFNRLTQDVGEETKRRYHADWMRLYSRIDIMDTGLNDCRRPDYRAVVQADADWLKAANKLKSVFCGGVYVAKNTLRGCGGDLGKH